MEGKTVDAHYYTKHQMDLTLLTQMMTQTRKLTLAEQMLRLVAYLLLHPKGCDVVGDDDADADDLRSDRRSDLVSDGDDSGAVLEKSRMTIGDHCYIYEKDLYVYMYVCMYVNSSII